MDGYGLSRGTPPERSGVHFSAAAGETTNATSNAFGAPAPKGPGQRFAEVLPKMLEITRTRSNVVRTGNQCVC